MLPFFLSSHNCGLFLPRLFFFSLRSRHRLYFHFSRSLVPCDKVIGEMGVAKATALSRDVSRWHARSPAEAKVEKRSTSGRLKTRHVRSWFYLLYLKYSKKCPYLRHIGPWTQSRVVAKALQSRFNWIDKCVKVTAQSLASIRWLR